MGDAKITAVDLLRNVRILSHKHTSMDEFVNCKLDYVCTKFESECFLLSTKAQMHRLQLVKHLAITVTYRSPRRDHVTPILKTCYYLIINSPSFKILVLLHKCIHGNAPLYLSDLLDMYSSG